MKELDPTVYNKHGSRKNFQPQYFQLYRACLSTAWGLLDEAQMLTEKQSYARAYALAFTATEEIGKALVVADYVYDLVSEQEFQDAFKKHEIKLAYLESVFSAANGEPERDAVMLRQNFLQRMSALYVGKSDDGSPEKPQQCVSRDSALQMIAKVQEYLTSILSAEWLNSPRIGSKALLK